jgi:hypothetical protein
MTPSFQLDRSDTCGAQGNGQGDRSLANAPNDHAGGFGAVRLLCEEDAGEQHEHKMVLLSLPRAAPAIAEPSELLSIPEDRALDAPTVTV